MQQRQNGAAHNTSYTAYILRFHSDKAAANSLQERITYTVRPSSTSLIESLLITLKCKQSKGTARRLKTVCSISESESMEL